MTSEGTLDDIKAQLIETLSHPEASDGLYLRNFFHMHEEDERPRVSGTGHQIMDALNALVQDGDVRLSEVDGSIVFMLARKSC